MDATDNVYLQKLSQNLLEILNDDGHHDVTIEVGDDPYVKTFHAHSIILNYRSPYFRKILSTNDEKKSDENLPHIKLPNISPEIFQIILRYIYGGIISLKEYDASDIVKILVAANELNLEELIPNTQLFLIMHEMNWIEKNFNLIYRTSFENDSFSELQNFCTELMSKQPEKIFNSSDFTSISEKALISIIQNENLQMSDVQVWQHVLKWGIAQNSELPSDLTTYSNDDYSILKDTLIHCIPFIKFYNLTSREFLDNILPYQKLFPEELYMDLLKIFLDHDYRPSVKEAKEKKVIKESKEIKETEGIEKIEGINSNKSINSKIIMHQHVELISKWVDGLDDEILGGYNPIIWESKASTVNFAEYSKTKDSFIFSFKNKRDIKNHILSRVEDEKYAIDNYLICGPSFGRKDLKIRGGSRRSFNNCTNSCTQLSYEKPIRETEDNFAVEDYEVFQIMSG
ncbi:BTB/POZ protein [Rhizophagus irregularis DAOM 181602=DAOM 197198]|nr:BTB/POZ protein [Rhizophagus irregularis DAOM 181602=DAOM 197198]